MHGQRSQGLRSPNENGSSFDAAFFFARSDLQPHQFMAAASGITMAPHNCEGPIGGLATIAVDAAMPNFLVQEVCSGVQPEGKEKIWEEWLGFPAMRMVNGRFPLLDKPGLGFELSEDALKRFPFGGTRPMSRVFQSDGSVAEW